MNVGNVGTHMLSVQRAKDMQAPKEMTGSEISENIRREPSLDVENDEVINEAMLDNSIKQANKNLEQYNRMIERTVHEKTHTIMYTLKDTLTNEVIREFPPKKIQDMIAKMWEMAGILVDERR